MNKVHVRTYLKDKACVIKDQYIGSTGGKLRETKNSVNVSGM